MLQHSPYRYLSRFYTMLAALLYVFLFLFHIFYPFFFSYIVSLPFYSIVSAVLSISTFLLLSCTIFLCCSLVPYEYSIAPLKSYLSSPFFVCFASCSTSTSFYDLPRVYNIPTRRCSIPLRTLCKHTASTHALRLSKVL